MGKSGRLRLEDAVAAMRLVGECRGVGYDPVLWGRHLAAGLCRLTGARKRLRDRLDHQEPVAREADDQRRVADGRVSKRDDESLRIGARAFDRYLDGLVDPIWVFLRGPPKGKEPLEYGVEETAGRSCDLELTVIAPTH